MSEFVKHIEARLGFRDRILPGKPDLRRLSAGMEIIPPKGPFTMERQVNYEMTVSYRHRGYCDPKDLENLKKNFIRDINNRIYGDFFSLLIDLERAIYEREDEESRSIIQQIFKEVGL